MQLAAKIRTRLSRRRALRLARRRLSAELAAFTTAAERTELELMLDRHDSEESREIRSILLRQDAGRR
jgi:hypothetical protein